MKLSLTIRNINNESFLILALRRSILIRHQNGYRFVIQLSDLKTEDELDLWPLLRDIVREKVRPERLKLGNNPVNSPLKRRWWAYQAHRPELYSRLSVLRDTMCIPRVTTHANFCFCKPDQVFSDGVVVLASDNRGVFSTLQARSHEIFARFFSSTLGDGLRYAATDCLATFPFPSNLRAPSQLDVIGRTYHDHRAALMIARNEGLTKTYNRFHDPAEQSADIVRLRELHAEMDRAVLRAYAASASNEEDAAAWNDLADRAEPIFLDETNEDDHTYQGRLFWPSAFRDEVLSRLLALNAERAAAERAAGLAPPAQEAEDAEEFDASTEMNPTPTPREAEARWRKRTNPIDTSSSKATARAAPAFTAMSTSAPSQPKASRRA